MAIAPKRNDKRYVLSKLNECKNRDEEVNLIKALVEGPKFFAIFANFEDAKKTASKIPYIDRNGTVTYIRSMADGYHLFTGGQISGSEASQVAQIIMDPNSRQKATYFYDWSTENSEA